MRIFTGRSRSLYFCSTFAALALLALAALCGVPLFAQSLDLGGYTAAKAEEYHALPFAGPNFRANSRAGYALGRYYLKGKVAACILAAYAELEKSHPQYRYLYGEMGWKGGGRFRPHRTHQKGMNADFMTPMIAIPVASVDPVGVPVAENATAKDVPAPLPCNAANLWGYAVRLDERGRFAHLRMDSKAMIAHLAALQKHAPRYGLRVGRVIFDPPLLKLLRADPDFSKVRDISFMRNKAWFPHDGHYQVDFVTR